MIAVKNIRRVAIAAAAFALLGLGIFFHYYLPRGEVVVLTGTEVMRFRGGVDEGAVDQAPTSGATRDVRLIYARTPEGKAPRTYRNEDAVWYAKFDSGTLNSRVQSILHDQQKGQEVHILALSYGWRIEWWSSYPNLLSVRIVEPGYVYWPWHAALVLLVLFGALGGIGWWALKAARAARRAAEDAVSSARDRIEAVVDGAGDAAARAARSVRGEPRPAAPVRPRPIVPNISSER